VGLFVSYSSQDQTAVETLAVVLRRTRQQVWLKEQLGGGDTWWATTLERIRDCDVFVVALSNHSLSSRPCQAELAYAQALRRPILLVRIAPVNSMRVNPLADRQFIDYQQPTADTGTELMSVVHTLAEQTPPLPDPLPTEPPMPYGYLTRLSARVNGPELNPREQMLLVAELKSSLDEDGADPTARSNISALLHTLHERPDITWHTRTDIDTLLGGPSTPPRSINKWIVGGIAAAALATVIAIVGAFAITGSDSTPTATTAPTATSPPFATSASLDALLLTNQEINTIMAATLQPEQTGHSFNAKAVDISQPDCLGALFPGQQVVYGGSGWTATIGQSLQTPPDPGTWRRVTQAVTSFPSADQARAFFNTSANKWRSCSGQTVTINGTFHWHVGDFVGDATKIALTITDGDAPGLGYQRVLSAVSNLVIDVMTTGHHLTGEGNEIADQIATKATH
jgi:hypothetical protein